MRNVSTNKLQNELSKVIKDVEGGEIYQVSRYSKPVAFLISKNEFEKLVSAVDCKECVKELREIAKKARKG